MTDSFWYPSVEDILDIHEDIVSEYPDTSPGIWSRGDIEFALECISEGASVRAKRLTGAMDKTGHGDGRGYCGTNSSQRRDGRYSSRARITGR